METNHIMKKYVVVGDSVICGVYSSRWEAVACCEAEKKDGTDGGDGIRVVEGEVVACFEIE